MTRCLYLTVSKILTMSPVLFKAEIRLPVCSLGEAVEQADSFFPAIFFQSSVFLSLVVFGLVDEAAKICQFFIGLDN